MQNYSEKETVQSKANRIIRGIQLARRVSIAQCPQDALVLLGSVHHILTMSSSFDYQYVHGHDQSMSPAFVLAMLLRP
jgi:hypothetical protein